MGMMPWWHSDMAWLGGRRNPNHLEGLTQNLIAPVVDLMSGLCDTYQKHIHNTSHLLNLTFFFSMWGEN